MQVMKRKAEKQQSSGPVSAIAAHKARQQRVEVVIPVNRAPDESVTEPPSKKARHSPAEENSDSLPVTNGESQRGKRRGRPAKTERTAERRSQRVNRTEPELELSPVQNGFHERDDVDGEVNDDEFGSPRDDDDGYESPINVQPDVQSFPLSKTRLNKSSIVHSDEYNLCVRIREKTNLAVLGHYDLWVKRGVVSLMGAKLHPSPRLYRVYAPSTHSLPVVKCVSGVNGDAEVEIRSCRSGIYRLRDLSPLYQRIWNDESTPSDKLTFKGVSGKSKRTFSLMHTSADDSLKRHLRPLHLEKKWSTAINVLSQRGGRLKAMVCGPKASGKSTFSRYLLNHLLSPAPQTENKHDNSDGVAFLDLDPGQPEFSPMGQVYLAHLRSPFFGPPFTHPSLDGSNEGTMIRAHHIGATSPRDDADHYVLAAMDLVERYRALLASYPQCPLIINYPGWIFGQGLEVATWLVRSLGLSDVVYMSEKGPTEVVEPLGAAAHAAMTPLITLPSQPTDFVSRSSAQLRSMQIQSYFHISRPAGLHNPVWLDAPMSHNRPILVDYAGPRQGILGIMVMGSQISPDFLHDVVEGSIVAVVAVESVDAIMGAESYEPERLEPDTADETTEKQSDHDVNMDEPPDTSATEKEQQQQQQSDMLETTITRTKRENLPYLFVGTGSSIPLDPRASHSLGLAIVRSVNVASQKLELITPIPTAQIAESVKNGRGVVLVRGQLDNPNWAISEEYYAARSAERRHQRRLAAKARTNTNSSDGQREQESELKEARRSAILADRVRRAGSHVPWMKVVDDGGRRQREAAAQREKGLWKLKKKAYPGSDSETE